MILLFLLCCTQPPSAPAGTPVSTSPPSPRSAEGLPESRSPSGLRWVVLRKGAGEPPRQGQQVELRYDGWRADGRHFDGSGNRSVFLTLGHGQMLEGWEEAVSTMPAGECRQLKIPPRLGFGDRGIGGIGAEEELTYELELLSIR